MGDRRSDRHSKESSYGSDAVMGPDPAVLLLVGCAAKRQYQAQQRNTILQMRQQTLSTMYGQIRGSSRRWPELGLRRLRQREQQPAGDQHGTGYGVLRDHRTGRDTYMKMASAGFRGGMGIKKFQAPDHLQRCGGAGSLRHHRLRRQRAQADLAAKSAEDGKVVVSEAANADFQKVKMYQITERGGGAGHHAQGYKYWPDDELNGN